MKSKATIALEWILAVGVLTICAIALLGPGVGHVSATGPTLIASQTPKGPYPTSVGAGALALTFTAADTVNGNSFAMSGHELLVIFNSGASPYTVTLTSVVDQRGRTGDVTAYSVAAGTYAIFNFRSGSEGWQQSDGTVHFSASNVAVEFAIIYVP